VDAKRIIGTDPWLLPCVVANNYSGKPWDGFSSLSLSLSLSLFFPFFLLFVLFFFLVVFVRINWAFLILWDQKPALSVSY
jgi:hypothetical protein